METLGKVSQPVPTQTGPQTPLRGDPKEDTLFGWQRDSSRGLQGHRKPLPCHLLRLNIWRSLTVATK